jgi:non-structural maintenance of chromosomes element 1
MSHNGDVTYNHTHRAFLQALLAQQTITYAAAKPILAAIQTAHDRDSERQTLENDITQDDFETYIDSLNQHISPFDLEIRSTLHQATKERVYSLVNTTSDALTQMSTTFSVEELGFVRRMLDAMFETYNTRRAEIMALTSIQALQCARPSGDERRRESTQTQGTNAAANVGLTGPQAERVLDLLEEQGWFEKSSKGFYSISPRALMELKGWLMEMYNQDPVSDDEDDAAEHIKIKLCAACREIVTVGQRCPDLNCACRMHDFCVRNIFRAQGGREICPSCKRDWATAPPVGEKAARSGGRRASANGVNGAARQRSSNMMTNGTGDESDAQSGTEE